MLDQRPRHPSRRDLHPDVEGPIDEHPITPAGRILDHPLTVALFLVVALSAALAASIGDGGALLTWDEPFQRWVEERRTGTWGDFFRFWSRLGSNVVIFGLGAVMALVASRRSKILAVTIVAAVLMRPLFEYVIKDLIGRPRPDIDQLIPGTGFSHPSGHVLASVCLYGLVPPLIALFTQRKLWWWLSSAVVVVIVVPLIAASRVYLGVHWVSDVANGLVIGTLYLLAVEWLFVSLLRRYPGQHESDAWEHLLHPVRTIHEHHDAARVRRSHPPADGRGPAA